MIRNQALPFRAESGNPVLQTHSLTQLQRAVFEAVAYADVFDFPVTVEEIHRALPFETSLTEVEAALDDEALAAHFRAAGPYYVLAGREALVDVRHRRAEASATLRRSAAAYGSLIAKLPFVRMVAVTGSLAVDNAEAGDDIDYLIVTAKRRLWLARGLTMLVVRLAKLRGLTLCPNYLLSEAALSLPERDRYTARELLQMQPVAGHETYRRMLQDNAWARDLLPNWEQVDPLSPGGERVRLALSGVEGVRGRGLEASVAARTLGERFLGGRLGAALERWLMRRKAAELNGQGGDNAEAVFNEDVCKGHFDAHRARLQQALTNRMERLEPEPQPAGQGDSKLRVLLGHSYFLRFDPKLWQAMQPYPPLGTLYAAAVLREHGHEVRLFDAMLAESTDGWRRMLRDETPDVAVLFEDNFNYLSKMCLLNMREAAFEMIAAARERGVEVIVCGADVTDHAADYLRHGATYALSGEGEDTLLELLDTLASGGDGRDVPGLAYLDGAMNLAPVTSEEVSVLQDESCSSDSTIRSAVAEGFNLQSPSHTRRLQSPSDSRRDEPSAALSTALSVVTTPDRGLIRDLDSLPPPARDLVDLDAYRTAWRSHGRLSMNLVTSRGCPFHCNWCAKPIWGQRYAVRSPEDVVEEIRRLRDFGVEHLWFMDDIFGLKPGWLPQFADAVEAANLQMPFKCLSRADLLLREGEIDALRRAGCEMVWLGAESGSQSVLDAMEKGTTVEQVREAARRLKDAGISVAFFLQFGYPGETWDDIQRTLQLVRDCDPDDVGVSVSYPLPGTPFYERVRDRITGRSNWVDSADLAMLYDGPYPTSFYHLLHSRLHAEFRLRKARRGRGLLPAFTSLLRGGRPRRAAALIRDAAMLPLLEVRLELARRHARPNPYALPVALSRDEAGMPSSQDEPVGSRR